MFRVAALILATGIATPCHALVTPHTPSNLHQQWSSTGKRGARPSQDTQKPTPIPPENSNPYERPDQPYSWNQKNTRWPTAVFNWIWEIRPSDGWQALFNGLLVGVGILQWRVYRRQADIAEGTRKIAEAGLGRPYVFFEFVHHNFARWPRSRENLRFSFRIINYGTSPAIIEGVFAYVFVGPGLNQESDDEAPKTKRFPRPDEVVDLLTYHGDVRQFPVDDPTADGEGPRWAHGRSLVLGVSKASEVLLAALGKRIIDIEVSGYAWLIGRIQYEDTFGTCYRTSFCIRGTRDGGITEEYGPPYNERT